MQPHTIVAYDAELKELDGLIGDMAGGMVLPPTL